MTETAGRWLGELFALWWPFSGFLMVMIGLALVSCGVRIGERRWTSHHD